VKLRREFVARQAMAADSHRGSEPRRTALPDKLFFRIGEVSRLVGVETHVLRYWETQFRALAPKKTRGAHRHYSRKDVELAMLIKRLVHDEGYTLAGAKKRLTQTGHHRRHDPSDAQAARHVALRAELLGLRAELEGLLAELAPTRPAAELEDEPEPASVTIHQVVPARTSRRTRHD